ncbi:MAG TPA: condensation domain-containing protein, partial [Streptosporangiaceae bacterium]
MIEAKKDNHHRRPEPEAPAASTEAALLLLFRELLGNQAIGADDDFFALGGHSLLAGRLSVRIKNQFGVNLELPQIHAGRTAARMAAMIEAGGDDGGPPVPPPLRPAVPGQRIPLTFPQERIWLLELISPSNISYQFQAALHLHGPLDTGVLTRVLNELVQRHDVFRTRFTDIDGVPLQQVVPAIQIDVPVRELPGQARADQERAAAKIIEAEVRHHFDIGSPPLVRWTVLRYGPQEHVLLHVEHHMVHDGWSFAVLYAELAELYEARLAGRPSPLPGLRLGFGDLAVWQHDWLRGPALARFVNHWTARLAGAPALDLPTDRPRPDEFSFRGAVHRFQMPEREYRALRACAGQHGVTLFSLMFTGFAALMSLYAAQHDFMIGVGVANRRTAEAERLVGMVVNTLPLRVDLSGDPALPELLHRVHETAVDAYAWQDVPLQRLVKALGPVRDLSRNPLFSTMFSFHDSAVPDLEFDGVRGEVTYLHNGSAKSEFNVVVIPRAEQRVGRAAGDQDMSMQVIWEYATDLFDRATVEAL